MLVLLILLAALVLAARYAWRRVRAVVSEPTTSELIEQFDEGLAIPMRDCDTRPRQADRNATPTSVQIPPSDRR